MYAFDSVLVNAGMLCISVTVTGPLVAEGAAASVSVELEEGVEEVEAAAEAIEVGEEEEEDMEDVAVIQRNGCLALRQRSSLGLTHCHYYYLVDVPTVQQWLLLRTGELYCRIAYLLALAN